MPQPQPLQQPLHPMGLTEAQLLLLQQLPQPLKVAKSSRTLCLCISVLKCGWTFAVVCCRA